MSELKVHKFCGSDEFFREYPGPVSNEIRPYYLKSEADKVIAELQAQKAQAEDDCAYWKSKAQRERHNKYKRCLKMAELCRAKRNEIIARTPTLILNHPTEYLTRWENRWLELAEKFKEVK